MKCIEASEYLHPHIQKAVPDCVEIRNFQESARK